VIDPSVSHAEHQGVGEILHGWPGERRTLLPVLGEGEMPRPADRDVDGIVVLGSAASVHDEHPWAAALEAWIRPVVTGEVEVPLLGVCYGHQLVAHMAGARIGFLQPDRARRRGVEETEILPNRLIPDPARLRVVVSHREEVKTAPSGYRVIARRPGVAFDGLEHRSLPIFTFQFHPEARDEFARRRGIEVQAIDDRLREDSRRLIAAFHRFAMSHRRP
jgi:GMP synthase-like glutamine amidotransferase